MEIRNVLRLPDRWHACASLIPRRQKRKHTPLCEWTFMGTKVHFEVVFLRIRLNLYPSVFKLLTLQSCLTFFPSKTQPINPTRPFPEMYHLFKKRGLAVMVGRVLKKNESHVWFYILVFCYALGMFMEFIP